MEKLSAKGKKHVLIVDDEPAVRRTVRSALESAGYECSESENGAAALAWLEENKADAIIADYHMPVLSGLKLLEKVRAKLNAKSPPVIMLTASLEEKDKQKASWLPKRPYTSSSGGHWKVRVATPLLLMRAPCT